MIQNQSKAHTFQKQFLLLLTIDLPPLMAIFIVEKGSYITSILGTPYAPELGHTLISSAEDTGLPFSGMGAGEANLQLNDYSYA